MNKRKSVDSIFADKIIEMSVWIEKCAGLRKEADSSERNESSLYIALYHVRLRLDHPLTRRLQDPAISLIMSPVPSSRGEKMLPRGRWTRMRL